MLEILAGAALGKVVRQMLACSHVGCSARATLWRFVPERTRRAVLRGFCKGSAPSMIITSLLDTDLYKFTMMQVVLHQFPGAQVEYKFKCRNPGVQLAPFANEIRDEIRSLCSLQFQDA